MVVDHIKSASEQLRNVMMFVGVIFVIIGISCFCYVHKTHGEEYEEGVQMVDNN